VTLKSVVLGESRSRSSIIAGMRHGRRPAPWPPLGAPCLEPVRPEPHRFRHLADRSSGQAVLESLVRDEVAIRRMHAKGGMQGRGPVERRSRR